VNSGFGRNGTDWMAVMVELTAVTAERGGRATSVTWYAMLRQRREKYRLPLEAAQVAPRGRVD